MFFCQLPSHEPVSVHKVPDFPSTTSDAIRRKPLQLVPQAPVHALRLPPPPAHEPDLVPQRLKPALDAHLLRDSKGLEGGEGGLCAGEVTCRRGDAVAEALLALLVAAEVEGELLLRLGGGLGEGLDRFLFGLGDWG